MKTAVFTGIRQIELQECPTPEPPDDKVLVKTEACALCTWEQRVYTGVKKVNFPFIGGHETAGRIVSIGKRVDRRQWHVGDQVVIGNTLPCRNCYLCKTYEEQNCQYFDHSRQLEGMPYPGMGGLSEYQLAEPNSLFHFKNVTPAQAALTEPLSCVVHSVTSADIQIADTVVVIGCGIMGLFHVLLSQKRGAKVIVSDVEESRLALAKRLGAHVAVNPSKENLRDRVIEETDGVGAQVVFDTTPNVSVLEDAFRCVGNVGKLVLYSSFYPPSPAAFQPDWIHKNGIRIIGTANSNSRDFVRAAALISEGIVDTRPFISASYPLARIGEAFESAVAGGKFRVVVEFP